MLIRTYDEILNQSAQAERYVACAKKTSSESSIAVPNGGEPSRSLQQLIHAREMRPVYESVIWERKGQQPVVKEFGTLTERSS